MQCNNYRSNGIPEIILLYCITLHQRNPPTSSELSGLPTQTQIAAFYLCHFPNRTPPPLVALDRSFKSQIAVTYVFAIPAAIYRNVPGPGLKVPHGVLFEQFWAPASECPKECSCAFWGFWGPKSTRKALFGALRGRCPKLLKRHSMGHFQARAPQHSCKWRPGS